MSDVHFQNVYGDFQNSQFAGIPTRDGKHATIRTMYAQLTSTLATDWADATARADKLATAAGLRLDDFAAITACDFYGDFHRTVYAGELALRDMGQQRVNQYKLLMEAFPATPAAIARVGDKPSDQNPVHVPFQNQFKQVFSILKGLGSAKPSDHFTVDLKGKKVSNASNNGLSFKSRKQ